MSENHFQIYLVGGAVRDQLLNLPVQDRDWVIVGATPEALLQQGYHQVGKDFPVFLHPQTKEEYALARTERKSGAGYTGFICDFSPDINLEQDLIRRDLTINAMAQDLQGNLFDPYGGAQDLANRVLRHVSPAFVEDPLRVLRVARFAARYHYLGFKIAEETLQLMKDLTAQGELQHLTAERVWAETEKALNEKNPEIYFEILRLVGALKVLFPELDALYGVPNPAKYHPEIDSFVHTMLVLKQATLLSEQVDCHKSAVRFAAICHDLGKAKTPKQSWPHHHGHEKLGIAPTQSLCKRLKVPGYYQQLAELTCEYHSHIHKIFELRPETIVKLFNTFDVWRKPLRFMEFLLVCFADMRGRKGFSHIAYPQQEFTIALYRAVLKVDIQSIIAAGFENKAIRDQLNRGRIFAVKQKRTEILPHFKPST
ncbi:multifunctional CCA addition/repair protein [Aggregatibacter actinomycetemcomitans]|uniref:multifunctional CCA addition/repair protein n=1 Tax=Aggregatibacter actinomycetemcomitans TaxID=714 RepID=UPI00022AC080|nr:multifunctional CCA addition/repair protein [Aggregatibacter actinomycetemcomitans]KOE70033.1 2', 3'-cyclic nucleotide 2'-phosphodiesterase [Aggregatibacter actinomycetemcomitans serotype f str. D18P1]KYK88874.1 CCA-adding protein [Aggregatibacter actinomycetemcomitans serotype f str. SC29R]MBN6061475.1 multifunctional CCA addition/repair protein [Aggregatibacter actinomycetemcomitans]OZV16908.1 multifunctional CCA addition/repair protein [Aggregatibacter actinomycetemcomitans]UEL52677.1 mu